MWVVVLRTFRSTGPAAWVRAKAVAAPEAATEDVPEKPEVLLPHLKAAARLMNWSVSVLFAAPLSAVRWVAVVGDCVAPLRLGVR